MPQVKWVIQIAMCYTQTFKDKAIDTTLNEAFSYLYSLLIFVLSDCLKPELDEAIFDFKVKLR